MSLVGPLALDGGWRTLEGGESVDGESGSGGREAIAYIYMGFGCDYVDRAPSR